MRVRRYIFVVCFLFAQIARSQDNTNVIDLVSFYKRAFISPPEVESFVAGQQTLHPISQKKPFITNVLYYSGARSGSNFFIAEGVVTNLLGLTNAGPITARSGDSRYSVAGHILGRTIGTNSAQAATDATYSFVRQFLDMGANEVDPSTVVWSGDTFTATNILGIAVTGNLEVSNNLPGRLEMRFATNPNPYKVVTYTYPSSPGDLSGFPAMYLISTRAGDTMQPAIRILIKKMQLANQTLAQDFFNDGKFASLIRYTNVFSNSDFYAFNTRKKQLVKANSLLASGSVTNSRSHFLVYTILVLPTIGLVTVVLIQKKRKQSG